MKWEKGDGLKNVFPFQIRYSILRGKNGTENLRVIALSNGDVPYAKDTVCLFSIP